MTYYSEVVGDMESLREFIAINKITPMMVIVVWEVDESAV